MLFDLRTRVFDHFQRLSVAFCEKYTTGRIMSRLGNDIDAIAELFLTGLIDLPWGVLSPLARAEWEHEFKGGNRLITGGLVADPLRTVFGAPTNTPDRDYANVAVGLTATLPRGASAFAHYETVLGRDRVSTHSFTAGLRFQFD